MASHLKETYGPAQGATLCVGTVLSPAPATAAADLFVEIASFGDGRWGPCPFMPKASAGAPLLPQVGDECLVALDENGQAWVLVWG